MPNNRFPFKATSRFLLFVWLTLFPSAAGAYDFKAGGLCYDINNDGASVTLTRERNTSSGYADISGALSVPAAVTHNSKTYTVTSIGDKAFFNCPGLTSVSIPNSVTSIGDSTFWHCRGLAAISLPDSLSTIGIRAFAECASLTAVTIPYSVASLGSFTFSGCTGLTSVVWNSKCCNDFTYDNDIAPYTTSPFGGLANITTFVFGEKVERIPAYLCSELPGLTSLTFPNSITSIGNAAFFHCTGLTSVCLPPSVTHIGSIAFYNCSSLSSVTLPCSATPIGGYAFDGCSNLTTLTLTGKGASHLKYKDSVTDKIDTLIIGSEITSFDGMHASLSTIYCYAATPPTCSPSTFDDYDAALHVPAASTIAYFTANYWKNFNNLNNDLTEKVELDQQTVNLLQRESITLEATATPEESALRWSTTNPAVATVDNNGAVTAVAIGECDVFASLESAPAVYASCHVSVSYPEITLALSEEELVLGLGEETTLTAIVTPDGTGLKPSWSSSDNNVAVVNDGVVTARGEGECIITATLLGKNATCHVTVTGEITITLDKQSATIGPNSILTVYPSCTPDIAVDFAASSSDTDVALVRMVNRNGAPHKGFAPALASTKAVMVVGVSKGYATITVSSADGKAAPAILEVRVVDVNGDGLFTVSDVTAIYDIILGTSGTLRDDADLNGDGEVTVADVTIAYDIINGIY